MTDSAETQRAILSRVEEQVGDLASKLDTVSTQVTELTTEMRLNRLARDKSDANHEAAKAEQDRRITALEMWRTQVETTAAAAPPLTGAKFLKDARAWVLAGIAVAGTIWGFTH